jgi:hypothetical protein
MEAGETSALLMRRYPASRSGRGGLLGCVSEGKKPMAHKNKVVHSYNLEGECRCIDVFIRPDGSYGFEEYRRDAEDGRGWFPVGGFAEQRFGSSSDALIDAQKRVRWLAEVVGK